MSDLSPVSRASSPSSRDVGAVARATGTVECGGRGCDDGVVTDPQPIDLARHTGFLVRRAQQAHLAAWAQEVGPQLTNVQFGVLNVLRRRGEASQRELCDDLDLDRSTIAGLVARLEARELVARVRAEEDRRRNVVRLTDAGLALLEELVPAARRVDDVLTSALTRTERETLQRLLTKVLGGDPEA